MAQLILASNSPRRIVLLRELLSDFAVIPSDAEEVHSDHLTGGEAARVNAFRKACSVAVRHPDALVIGADTLVYLGIKAFGKPRDLEEARRMLHELQGRTHEVLTGVCLLQLGAGRRRVFLETTHVTFRPLSSPEIERYLASIDPLDKAGAYAIQEGGSMLVDRITGSYSNVVGLPLERLREELGNWPESLCL